MAKASNNEFPSVLFGEQASAPTTPAAGTWRAFCQSDGLYVVDDAGAVTGPLAAADSSVDSSQQTASYTLALVNAGTVVEMNSASAVTVTVPANASVAFPVGTIIELYAMGAGPVTIAGDAGVTVRNAGALSGQYATASLRKRATDEWVLTGSLA